MRLVEFTESPRSFHARQIPEAPTTEVWWNRLTEPALVLGSTQRDDAIVDVDACRDAGIDNVRRRSGGGAVVLFPGDVTWFDVIVATGSHPGLGDDVHAPMLWLGERLVVALQPHVDGELVARGPGMVPTRWSSLLCFDGLGPGEVLLDGRKLVGISQRRTRAASRLQCCWYSRYEPASLVDLLAAAVRPPLDELAPVATIATTDDLVRRVLQSLPTP